MANKGYPDIIVYLDDFFYCSSQQGRVPEDATGPDGDICSEEAWVWHKL